MENFTSDDCSAHLHRSPDDPDAASTSARRHHQSSGSWPSADRDGELATSAAMFNVFVFGPHRALGGEFQRRRRFRPLRHPGAVPRSLSASWNSPIFRQHHHRGHLFRQGTLLPLVVLMLLVVVIGTYLSSTIRKSCARSSGTKISLDPIDQSLLADPAAMRKTLSERLGVEGALYQVQLDYITELARLRCLFPPSAAPGTRSRLRCRRHPGPRNARPHAGTHRQQIHRRPMVLEGAAGILRRHFDILGSRQPPCPAIAPRELLFRRSGLAGYFDHHRAPQAQQSADAKYVEAAGWFVEIKLEGTNGASRCGGASPSRTGILDPIALRLCRHRLSRHVSPGSPTASAAPSIPATPDDPGRPGRRRAITIDGHRTFSARGAAGRWIIFSKPNPRMATVSPGFSFRQHPVKHCSKYCTGAAFMHAG